MSAILVRLYDSHGIWKNHGFQSEREVFIKFSKFYEPHVTKITIEMRLYIISD